MLDPVRQEIITSTHTVVVKVGTNVLTREDGRLEPANLRALVDQLQRIRATGRRVVLVSSGAIGAGMGRLGLTTRPTEMRQLQACAAIGQNFLMRAWEDSFAAHGWPTAQILLTAGDFDSRSRYLNMRNTLLTLFEWNCIPIINENDTISTTEIRFGDNDHLAALVTNLLQAPLLVLLTVVPGLYTADPGSDPNAQLITTVPHIDSEVLDRAGATRSTLGTGGMRSKLRAARLATVAGESVVMASGRQPGVLDALFACEPVGTLFLPQSSTMPAWKRWLGFATKPRGQILVDAGARRAVEQQGKSLLPIGIVNVVGDFGKGDVVAVCGPDGQEFARGLTNYPASSIEQIRGLRSEQARELLGGLPYGEVVHRDNLCVTT